MIDPLRRRLASAGVALLALASTLFLAIGTTGAQDWPGFRGPNADGRSADGNIPTKWSATENLQWKLALPGEGFSSPIVVGDKVFVTCYSDKKDLAKLKRHLVCVDRHSGKIAWQKAFKATAKEKPEWAIARHGYASHTPISDGERLYVWFGGSGLFAFDLDGNELWHQDAGSEMASKFGSASSPVLYGDLVIVTAGNESKSIRAYDRKSGKEVWKTKPVRPLAECYSTPKIAKNDRGEDELLVQVPDELWALNPKTGKLKWWAETRSDTCACPNLLVDDGIVYVVGGRGGGRVAVKIGGKDDVTKTNVLWSERGGSYVPSPVLHEGHLYWIKDDGTVHCVNVKTGKIVNRKRLRSRFYASVVLVDGKLIGISRFDGTYVLRATPKLELLAKNPKLDDSDHSASPAISDGQMFYRSDKFLYCISAKKAPADSTGTTPGDKKGEETTTTGSGRTGGKTGAVPSALDWPRFRGPNGTGVNPTADVPTTWSDTTNMKWKCELPGRGYSSPIVVGGHVIVSCYTGGEDDAAIKRQLVAVDRETGKIAWSAEVPSTAAEKPQRGRAFHGYASHTPVSDGRHVFVLFGNTGVIAFDTKGEEVWRKDVGHENAMQFGSGASPMIWRDLLIVPAGAESKMIWAFDRATGEVAWKTKAVKPLAGTYCTPVVAKNAAGEPELLISVPYEMWGLDPRTGKLKWYTDTKADRMVNGSLICRDGVAYVTAFGGRTAIKIGGKDDVTKTHTLWTEKGGTNTPSPALHGGHLFWVDDRGTAVCVDAKTGKELKKARVRGGFYASIVIAGDKIIAQSRFRGTYVLKADETLEQLAHNTLNDESDFSASPAVAGNALYLRSDEYLYCIAK